MNITAPHASQRLYLVGAGISVEEPSGVASVPALLEILYSWIARGNRRQKDQLWQATSTGGIHNHFSALRFEAVVQALLEVEPSMQTVLPLMAKHGAPNAIHDFLAREVANGAIVLTTNFDLRIESASSQRGNPLRAFVLSSRSRKPGTRDRLIKLHGSFARGRRPRATLTDIGQLGLSFSNFPELRKWLSAHSEGRDLLVMGYSASDHFDVVPLLEDSIGSKRIFWMDYDPNQKSSKWVRFAHRADTALPPHNRLDFVGTLLTGLAATKSDREIWRVLAPSCTEFLSSLSAREIVQSGSVPNRLNATTEKSTALSNVSAMRRRLASQPASKEQRAAFRRMLLEEDPYGGYLASRFEDKPESAKWKKGSTLFESAKEAIAKYGIERARARVVSRSASRLTPIQRVRHFSDLFYIEDQRKDYAASLNAAKALVRAEIELGTYSRYRANELLLMMFEDTFDNASNEGNRNAMRLAAREVDHLFQRTGMIGAGVQTFLMTARIAHADALKLRSERMRIRRMAAGVDAAKSGTYYALRAGRRDLLERSVWLYAFFLESTGQRTACVKLLERFLAWTPLQDVQARGQALFNIALVTARSREFLRARSHLKRLTRVRLEDWPERDVFAATAKAQIAAAEGNGRLAWRWTRAARQLLDADFPDDPSGLRAELDLLAKRLGEPPRSTKA